MGRDTDPGLILRFGLPALGAAFIGAANPVDSRQWSLIVAVTVSAFAGVLLGKRYLHKVTMKTVQTLTGILLTGIALLLGLGIV